jgi:predicted nucleotidyltransferase component of viral defense system
MDSAAQSSITWYLDALPTETRKPFLYLSEQKWLKDSSWYLAGGTALALQVNHRQSLDLDFFTQKKEFNLENLLSRLVNKHWKTDIARENTVYGELMGAKVSFIAYPFFVPKQSFNYYGAIPVLQTRDIVVMKLIAVSQRGKKRDFIDLYWYINNREKIETILRQLPKQCPGIDHNFHHILKSLVYFEDAEGDPMPKLLFPVTWQEVKRYFQREVPRVSKKLIGV